MAADRVDFIDKDDAGSVLLRLLEHVAHAACADTDEHLDEVGTGNGEERHIGLARDGARDQGLAGAGRPDQEHAARDAPAEPLVLAWIAQELDNFLQILLGLIDAGHVLKRDAAMGLGQKLRARLAEAERLAARPLHLAGQHDPNHDQHNEGEPRHQERDEPRHVVRQRTRGDGHALGGEARDQRGVAGRIGLETAAAVVERAVDVRTLNQDIAHLVGINLGEQLRV